MHAMHVNGPGPTHGAAAARAAAMLLLAASFPTGGGGAPLHGMFMAAALATKAAPDLGSFDMSSRFRSPQCTQHYSSAPSLKYLTRER